MKARLDGLTPDPIDADDLADAVGPVLELLGIEPRDWCGLTLTPTTVRVQLLPRDGRGRVAPGALVRVTRRVVSER